MSICILTSAQASIIAGSYSEISHTGFDGVWNAQSLPGGGFGVNDLSSGHSDGIFWSFIDLKRTYQDIGVWSGDIIKSCV